MRNYFFIAFCILSVFSFSQVKIEGTVIDAKTKERIPYANVIFKGTSKGTVSDINGEFYLESDEGTPNLIVSFIGYKSKEVPTKKGLQKTTIRLTSERGSLGDVTVIVGASNKKRGKKKLDPAYQLLQKIWKKKRRNGLFLYDQYEYEKYEKVEFDINNIDSAMINSRLFKGLEFVFEKIDTSQITGTVFLPIFINESISQVYGSNIPKRFREDIIANKSSGFKNNQTVIQQTKNLYSTYNIYDNFIKLFDKAFVSPLSTAGWASYNYQISDTAYIDNKLCFKMIYYPRRTNELTFKGEFWINDSTFAIKEIFMDATSGINVNFVNNIYIEQSYDVLNDSVFLLTRDYIDADIKVVSKNKEAKGMFAKRTTSYKKFAFDQKREPSFYGEKTNPFDKNIFNKTDDYWVNIRHEKLNKNEEGIYETLDRLEKTKKFRRLVDLFVIVAIGYLEVDSWNLDIGNLYNTFGLNDVEGLRLRLGARTYFGRNDPWRAQGYLAYGTDDKQVKYGISVKWLLNQNSRLTIGAGHTRDIFQLGGQLTVDDGVLDRSFASASLITRGENDKLSSIVKTNGFIEIEPFKNVTFKLDGTHLSIKSASETFSLAYKDPRTSEFIQETTDSRFGISAKFTPKIKTIGYGVERNIVSGNYPTIYMKYSQGINGVLNSDFSYQKVQFYYSHPWLIGPLGELRTTLEVGKTFGTVPLSLLDVPPGNQSFWIIPGAFGLLNYYEFITDTYASLHLEHHFHGKFFNRIPLIKKLKFREVIFFKGLWGDVSNRNKNLNASTEEYVAPNDDIYYEYGFGIENIGLGNWRIFRFDFNWRGNYLNLTENTNNFAVKFGIKVKF